MSGYKLPSAGQTWDTTLEIKRSTFQCYITRTEDEDQARNFIASIKKQHPKARHHCSAFIIAQENMTPLERSSDDGEPAGTAGHPMLAVLQGQEIYNCCAVVVRYFGGIKLGTGGLVRAYGDAVSHTLSEVPTITYAPFRVVRILSTFGQAAKLEAYFRTAGRTQGFILQDMNYSPEPTDDGVQYDAELTVLIPTKDADALDTQLRSTVAEFTGGAAEVIQDAERWMEAA